MAFPTTPVLDNFNRADEDPLSGGGNWAGFATSFYEAQLKLLSNGVTNGSTSVVGASYWTTNKGPDCEGYVTISTLPADGHYALIWLRAGLASGTDEANPFGYRALWIYSAGGTDSVYIVRCDDALTDTVLAGPISQDFSAGDKLGASIVGTVFTVYRHNGTSWSSVVSYDTVSDATKYSAAGRIVLGTRDQTIVLDDFGGGTVVAVTVTPPISLIVPNRAVQRAANW